MRRYAYVGPRELLRLDASPSRRRVASEGDVRDWAAQTRQDLEDGSVTATFVVDADGALWIADRRSEHVACAAGGKVLSAGEVEFDLSRAPATVASVTNQSTGYCPEPESWPAVEAALCGVGLAPPEGWAIAFDFRRCHGCGALCIVKEGDFTCVECEAELSRAWNCST